MVDLSDKKTNHFLLMKHIITSGTFFHANNTTNKNARIVRGVFFGCIFLVILLVVWQSRDPEELEIERILSNFERSSSRHFNGEKKKCLKDLFKDFLLVIHYDEPYYKDNTFVRGLYRDVFGKVSVVFMLFGIVISICDYFGYLGDLRFITYC